MTTLRRLAPALAVTIFANACALEVGDEGLGQDVAAVNQAAAPMVSIVEVGYGGTGRLVDGDKIIYPEYFVLRNEGSKHAKLDGWYLTDGASWTGDGVAQLPGGTILAPGEEVVIANYPPVTNFESLYGYRQVSFEYAYGYAPDLEIGGWEPSIRDAELVMSRIRLKHRECSYDAECVDVQEPVMLIDGSELEPDEVIGMLATDSLPEALIADTFPE